MMVMMNGDVGCFSIHGFHWCLSGRLEGWWSIQLLEGRSTSLQGLQLANIMEYEEIKVARVFFSSSKVSST